jgi:hypothetical protein
MTLLGAGGIFISDNCKLGAPYLQELSSGLNMFLLGGLDRQCGSQDGRLVEMLS